MRNRQMGVTLIGWLFLLTPLAVVIYAGIRLMPVYLNYMSVAKAMDQAGNDFKGGSAPDPQSIRVAIDKHLMVETVDYPTTKDMKITRDGGAWVVESKYEDEAPLFANLSLHVAFDKVVRLGSSGGGE
jgi:Domain of unknown function (DUF4845)